MVREPVIAHGPVVALHVRVLLRLSWLDELDMNAALRRPGQYDATDVVFWPVVAADHLRPARPLDDLVERADDALER